MLRFILIFVIIIVASASALMAQECYTIDRSRAEWMSPVSVEEINPASVLTLECFPNPFEGGVEIKIDAPENRKADLAIYDLQGNPVYVILASEIVGERTINWDGINSKGESVGSGTYLVKLTVGEATKTVKIVKAE